ncbi:MAG: hypothetical protein QW291_02185 [Thermofilaceae archaeon]
MSEEQLDLGRAIALADLAQRMRKYFLTVQAAYAFLFYGSFITAYWLVVVSLAVLLNAWNTSMFWIATMLALILLIILVGYIVAAASPRATSPVWRTRGKFFGLIFATPFIVLYALPWTSPFYIVVWYPALAISLLLEHLFIEKEEYRQGNILVRPFLLSSSIMLVTTPLVLAVTVASLTAGWMLALSLVLLSYSIAALVALRGARKLLGS